ncbi:hypothetical protein SapgrDRAFT_3198 [Saprospira grandis DSM 2844]|uniref:DUF4440 domain-containing protein n=1 Tax=Saprospira grandis DSM 2844 TaxID=694433 RepID=J1I8P6_9BACT|nr:hypothetical protein [Saprospira grandis]EJF54843.1 hypothetical protein SapgrDRAFT_3198 [Saprospira grandis DSM 2844]
MKLHYSLSLLLFCLVLAACESKTTIRKQQTVTTFSDSEEVSKKPLDRSDLGAFWTAFQQAVAKKDAKAIRELSHPNEWLERGVEHIDLYFDDYYVEQIANSKVSDLWHIHDANKGEIFSDMGVSDLYELSIIRWKEDEAGNKRSAVVVYYFGQVEGQFALLHIIAAGEGYSRVEPAQ